MARHLLGVRQTYLSGTIIDAYLKALTYIPDNQCPDGEEPH